MLEIYTPIEEVEAIIKERWSNQALKNSVEARLGGDVPEIFKEGPSGFIWHQICSPDGEFERFFNFCKKIALKPIALEYQNDKFAGRNFTKYNLAVLPFASGKTKNLETIVQKEKIIDFKDAERQKMGELKTLWGENLAEFHHALLKERFPEIQNNIVDISDWILRREKDPKKYYVDLLSLTLCHAVLFDDYETVKAEESFIQEVIIPAFKEVERIFGVRPIIVKLSDATEYQRDPYWWAYSPQVKSIMNNHLKKIS